MNFILRRLLRYRLIDLVLIGTFFHDHFCFQNLNLGQMSFVDYAIKQMFSGKQNDKCP